MVNALHNGTSLIIYLNVTHFASLYFTSFYLLLGLFYISFSVESFNIYSSQEYEREADSGRDHSALAGPLGLWLSKWKGRS